jgi:hypothetical protein
MHVYFERMIKCGGRLLIKNQGQLQLPKHTERHADQQSHYTPILRHNFSLRSTCITLETNIHYYDSINTASTVISRRAVLLPLSRLKR